MTAHEIESMGKKNPITGNVTMTADECRTLKDYAASERSFLPESELTRAAEAADFAGAMSVLTENGYGSLKTPEKPRDFAKMLAEEERRNSLAPSILAASITDFGIPLKKLYIMNTGKVENAPGSMTAHSVFMSPRFLSTIYSGSIST